MATCLLCKTMLDGNGDEVWGTIFQASGNYGSRVIDMPEDGKRLVVYLCDLCLLEAAPEVEAWYYPRPVRQEVRKQSWAPTAEDAQFVRDHSKDRLLYRHKPTHLRGGGVLTCTEVEDLPLYQGSPRVTFTFEAEGKVTSHSVVAGDEFTGPQGKRYRVAFTAAGREGGENPCVMNFEELS